MTHFAEEEADRDYLAERQAIREFCGRQPRAEAERGALEDLERKRKREAQEKSNASD